MSILIRIFGALVALIVVGVAAAVFYIDSLAARGIEAGASHALGVPTDVGSVSIGLLRGSFEMSNFQIANPPGFRGDFIFKFRHAGFDVDTSTLRQPTIKVPLFTLDGVGVAFEGGKQGSNVDAILANLKRFESAEKQQPAAKQEEAGDGPSDPLLVIDQLVIRDVTAWVDVADPTGLVRIDGVEVKIPEIRLQNVGGKSGVNYAQLTDMIVKAILVNVAKHGGKLPLEMVGQLTKGLKPLQAISTQVSGVSLDAAEKAADGVIRGGAGKLIEGVGSLLGGGKKE